MVSIGKRDCRGLNSTDYIEAWFLLLPSSRKRRHANLEYFSRAPCNGCGVLGYVRWHLSGIEGLIDINTSAWRET